MVEIAARAAEFSHFHTQAPSPQLLVAKGTAINLRGDSSSISI
jgi:hypothetical protein